MTTDEARTVARIMIDTKLIGSGRIVELLLTFPEVDLVEFFNGMDDDLDTATHDSIMYMIGQRLEGKS